MLKKLKLFSLAIPALAEDFDLGTPGGFENLEKVSASTIVSSLISIVLIVVSIAFFFYLVIGGLKWITSSGDEKKVAAARSQITNALIGLMIVFATWAIITLIGTLFNVKILDLQIPSFSDKTVVVDTKAEQIADLQKRIKKAKDDNDQAEVARLQSELSELLK